MLKQVVQTHYRIEVFVKLMGCDIELGHSTTLGKLPARLYKGNAAILLVCNVCVSPVALTKIK